MIGLAQPAYLVLLLAVAAMAYGAWRLAAWRSRARRDFAGPQAERWPASAFAVRIVLLLAAAAIVAFAAARPYWGTADRLREQEGVDFVIALDVSQSMEAADVEPSRLTVAQEQLVRLVEAERGSRIGLVLFAGNAFLRSPLTTDTEAMAQLIRRAGDEAGLVRAGSDLGAALDVAALVLTASEENRGRAVVLVSDGEDFVGTYPAKALELAQRGIAIHTVGVGTVQGAPLFDRNIRGELIPKRGPDGQPVVTRLEPAVLQTIADIGGGRYEELRPGNDLMGLRLDLRRLDPTPLGAETFTTPVERYQLFLGFAIGLLLLGWFLPARLALPSVRALRLQRGSGVAALLVALLVGACSGGDGLEARNREANRLYGAGDFQGALAIYQELLASRPDVAELSYNAGNALHRLENYDRAVAETRRALPPDEVRLGAATYYALGNHLLYLGRIQEAHLAYRNALLLDPRDVDAKYNLELTLLLLAAQQQPDGAPGPDDMGDAGNGEPQDGEGEPGEGDGTPMPGSGPLQPGATPQPGPQPGQPEQAIRSLAEALAGIDEELTFEEAIEILDLLRQQQQRPRPAPGGAPPGGRDY